ncbi:translation initiation factor IF-2-like [Suncus etruscus]|uniref:translation initiation factor IF-2-like n=1 Tax=Suncus etruscus TaxID=109475 RepID=UPI0021104E1B|nr:translation initiation factor IF-2-like [Suncus etruscus]
MARGGGRAPRSPQPSPAATPGGAEAPTPPSPAQPGPAQPSPQAPPPARARRPTSRTAAPDWPGQARGGARADVGPAPEVGEASPDVAGGSRRGHIFLRGVHCTADAPDASVQPNFFLYT